MGTDNELKNDLRIQLTDWEEILEYLQANELDRLEKKVKKIIDRIETSLQD